MVFFTNERFAYLQTIGMKRRIAYCFKNKRICTFDNEVNNERIKNYWNKSMELHISKLYWKRTVKDKKASPPVEGVAFCWDRKLLCWIVLPRKTLPGS